MQDNHDEHPEPLDSVPDHDQEHHGVDKQTRKKMERDVGDDETPYAVLPASSPRTDPTYPERSKGRPSGEKTRHTRHQDGTDRIHRVTLDEQHLRETSDGVADNLQEVGSSDSRPPESELTPEQYQYRIVATLPPPIQALIDEALGSVNLRDWIRGFQLMSTFQTQHLLQVVDILQIWGQKYLPLASRLLGVHTEVWGQNQYVAGWKINNVAAWNQAQNELTAQLAPFITADTSTPSAFRPFIGLMEYTPAAIYPHLVTYLNQQYRPIDFHIHQVSLLRMPLIQYASRVPFEQRSWQVYIDFPTTAKH
jgi:hypothetical protein